MSSSGKGKGGEASQLKDSQDRAAAAVVPTYFATLHRMLGRVLQAQPCGPGGFRLPIAARGEGPDIASIYGL